MGEPVVLNQGDSPREGGLRPRAFPRRWLLLLGALALLLVAVGVGSLVLYARGGGPLPSALSFLAPAGGDLLGRSSSQETVLRTLRLAGIERAVVGESGGTAVARVEVPSAASAADIDIAWQAAAGALAGAYPGRAYVVQVFGPGAQPLAQVALPKEAAAQALKSADSSALLKAATVTYLGGSGAAK